MEDVFRTTKLLESSYGSVNRQDFDVWFSRTYNLPKFATLPQHVQARIRKRFEEEAKRREYNQRPDVKARRREYTRNYIRRYNRRVPV